MAEDRDLRRRMGDTLALLEREETPAFDAVALGFSMLQDVLTLISGRYGPAVMAGWRRDDDPALGRYLSKLKFFLAFQKEYLASLSDVLFVEDDRLSEKIAACRDDIDALTEKENTLFRQGEALQAAEIELKERQARVDGLLRQAADLEALKAKLAAHDPAELAETVRALEAETAALQSSSGELVARKERLEADLAALREAARGLANDAARLENAGAREAAQLTARMPEWIEKLQSRRLDREQKAAEYSRALAAEAEKLTAVEAEIQELLTRINAHADAAAEMRDILETHFNADRELTRSFSRSLAGAETEVDRFAAEIQTGLANFDAALKSMHQRIETVAAQVTKIRIAD